MPLQDVTNLPVQHTPTFWRPELAHEYDRWWMPRGENVDIEQLSRHVEWPTHVRYRYPTHGPYRRVSQIQDAPDPPPDPHPKRKKRKITRSKGIFGSTQVVPEGHVRRVMKIRAFPTSEQRKLLKEWFSAARHTYNW